MAELKVIIAEILATLGVVAMIIHIGWMANSWQQAKEGAIPYVAAILCGIAYLLVH